MDFSSLAQAPAYYRNLLGGNYQSTVHAQGAWNPQEQHMAPVAGLLVKALEQFEAREGMRLTRFNFDILGMIPGGEFVIETTMLRPGKTIELLQAELISAGRVAVRLTAWRMLTLDTSAVAACEDTPMGTPEEATAWDGMTIWPGGFIESLEIRVVEGHRPGRGQAWLKAGYPLVEGEDSTPLSAVLGLVDTANGIVARTNPGPGGYMFPNVDLSIHVYREPVGQWLGLDTQVTFGDDGIGLTSSVLHDIQGPFGRSEQMLTVRPLPTKA